MRRIVLLALLVVALVSCGAERAVAPREPAPAAEVERTAAAFEAVTSATVEAWNSGDVEAVRELYTDDIEHHDTSFGAHIVGIDAVVRMASSFMAQYAGMESCVADWLIGSEDSLVVWELWNITLRGYEFTQDDPLVEVDLLETRGARISYWTLFYGLDTLEKAGWTRERLDEARFLLSESEHIPDRASCGPPLLVGVRPFLCRSRLAAAGRSQAASSPELLARRVSAMSCARCAAPGHCPAEEGLPDTPSPSEVTALY